MKLFLFAVVCILLFLFFQNVFLVEKEKGCPKKYMPICEGRLDCLGTRWRCSTSKTDDCDPTNIPSCKGVQCIAGSWRCPGDYLGDCDTSTIPEDCKESVCVDGKWKCVNYTKGCDTRTKPVCDDDEEAVCKKGVWSCEKGGCDIGMKPDCAHPICSQGKWICYNKFPGASVVMEMDLSTDKGMGGLNLVVEMCDSLTQEDCDPSYFLPIVVDPSSYTENYYSGFKALGNSPFTDQTNITAFVWNISQNPHPLLGMDLDFESCIMNGAGTDECSINLVVIDLNTTLVLASCNILRNSPYALKTIINTNSPLMSSNTPFPQNKTDWVFFFDSTLEIAKVGFALQFSTAFQDMEHSTFYNILPQGNNGPRTFSISSRR